MRPEDSNVPSSGVFAGSGRRMKESESHDDALVGGEALGGCPAARWTNATISLAASAAASSSPSDGTTMVIASLPGFSWCELTGRQLPSLSWIPSARERAESHSPGHFLLLGTVPALPTPHSRIPSRPSWRPIRACARDVQASSQWWFACFHMHVMNQPFLPGSRFRAE